MSFYQQPQQFGQYNPASLPQQQSYSAEQPFQQKQTPYHVSQSHSPAPGFQIPAAQSQQQQQQQPPPFQSFPSGSMDFNNVSGSIGDQKLSQGFLAAFSTSGYPGEPPLLEELGINFKHIKEKTAAVLNPRRGNISADIMTDSDLAGPILFCLAFATFLLLSGKTHFGYIYGVALFGTICQHILFKLMSQDASIDLIRTASVIGYCLLPLVLLSAVAVFVPLDNLPGYVAAILAILWCTTSASGFIVSVLRLQNVRMLIAYPLAMFYSVFALMAIFVEKTQ
ncbi:ER-derived COPII transport vesicles biogenesis [Komagataella phaffii CBS 7435]|uniref:Protein YIP n=2 Tax=Komagataella phaffii TaxID=460519 RepID=C4R0J4_KOMPG|nr:uncharacterized protein PAS_chr2-1_0397 [Komagataella phaffii GS115]AOA62814.1 GQ67_00438T0 [Komagataella phaffii]CAH2448464.1 ER-derived COPII transport vesicles biogenesis [Komagataella phaffii CBS 7435]AOA67428.1 GQ68_00951T0 [Komagataella phaffii GS115]CAY69018.1 Integral membrane protein required for the biogenesis of ER-derived COPII transport vesicles [Komagataella phaffii GS115]CCA38583.1 ER-derived COPII transport vesicles biogenesis [Komagataella phaffii CBS 7435]